MWFTIAALLLSTYLTSALAHNIKLGAHSRECFHESLHQDDKMTVSFQVGDREFGGSGNLEIDFWVRLLLRCNDSSSKAEVDSTLSLQALANEQIF